MKCCHFVAETTATLNLVLIVLCYAQEEMETLLGKACKQAGSSLHQMNTVLAADNSRRVCSVSITHMLCPDLVRQLDMAIMCLDDIPIMLERTLQLGRENEFFFEVELLAHAFLLLWLLCVHTCCHTFVSC